MSTLSIPTAQVFRPLLEPARYKGAFGGRGSGKSHFFAGLVVEECLRQPGTLVVCIREKQMTLAQSSKRLIEDKIEAFNVGNQFRVYDEKIRTPGADLSSFRVCRIIQPNRSSRLKAIALPGSRRRRA